MVKKGQCDHGWVNATQVLTGDWGTAVHMGPAADPFQGLLWSHCIMHSMVNV